VSRLVIEGGRRLSGFVEAPPDKSVSHRALLLAALGAGRSRIQPFRPGRDVASTAAVLRALGVVIEPDGADAVSVRGRGAPSAFRAPAGPLDCGNSGTTMRLLCGLLAGFPGPVVLDGDASLRRRPMERLRPIEATGARLAPAVRPDSGVDSTSDPGPDPGGGLRAPFTVTGVLRPRATTHRLAVPSAQVKSALLLAGWAADGPTEVWEPRLSRDHTERMLRSMGVAVSSTASADGVQHRLLPLEHAWSGASFRVPPDPSSAAFLLAAAWVTGSSDVVVRSGTNPTRTGFLDALAELGAEVDRTRVAGAGAEPVEDLQVVRSEGRGLDVAGDLALRSIDELPMIMGLMAFLDAPSRVRDAAELRVKESDRLEGMARVLRAFGTEVTLHPDGVDVRPGPLRPATVEARGDHRIAMTAAVIALGCEGTSVVQGADCIAISYPDFVGDLRSLGAAVSVEA
jgi:3-phosphoshikimate 1-carboxyvinyltransferase